jgi:hypothetical protein
MRRNDTHTICAPLLEIAISERTLRSLSETTVARYRGWLEQGREAPAIRIARVGDVYVVRDGRHRVAAALAAGHRFIEAEVRPIANWLRRLGRFARRLLGGGSPAAPDLGDEVLPEERLACTEEERVRLPPSPLTCLRSVNGKHAPFVRPRCGFNSCRRLLRTPVAQRNERCPATAEDAGSIPAGRIHADVAHREEHRVASPERPVRDGSSALEDSWCNGSTPSSNLGGPGSIPGESAARRRGPERLGYLMERGAQALAVQHRGPDRTP